jgi:hypothetical protein
MVKGKSNIQQRWEVVGENSNLKPRVDIPIPKIPDIDPLPEIPAKLPPAPEGDGDLGDLGGPPTAEIPPEIPPAGSDPAPEDTIPDVPDPALSEGSPSPDPYDPATDDTFNPDQARGNQNPDADSINTFKLTFAHLSGTIPRDKAIFYSGLAPNPTEIDSSLFTPTRLYSKDNGFTMWDGIFQQWSPKQGIKPADLTQLDKQIMSAAFARACSGDVRVVLNDAGVEDANTWTDYEWPELVANPDVTQIIRINSKTMLPDADPIWVQGDPITEWPYGTPVSQIRGQIRGSP